LSVCLCVCHSVSDAEADVDQTPAGLVGVNYPLEVINFLC